MACSGTSNHGTHTGPTKSSVRALNFPSREALRKMERLTHETETIYKWKKKTYCVCVCLCVFQIG